MERTSFTESEKNRKTKHDEFGNKFCDIPSDCFQVRGEKYFEDCETSGFFEKNNKDKKVESKNKTFYLKDVHMQKQLNLPITNNEIVEKFSKKDQEINRLFLVLNYSSKFLIKDSTYSFIAIEFEEAGVAEQRGKSKYEKFMHELTDAERNEKLKLQVVFRESKGIIGTVLNTIGVGTPVLLGKKLNTEYLQVNKDTFICVDTCSNPIASLIRTSCFENAKNAVVDLQLIIQADEQEELPEITLAGGRFHRVSINDIDFEYF